MDQRSFLPLVLITLLSLGFAVAQNTDVDWIWSGAVTTTSAVVKAKVNARTPCRLAVHPVEQSENLMTFPDADGTTPDPNGIVTFKLDGLQPGKKYRYSLEIDGKRAAQGVFGTFQDGPMPSRIIFGSCASTGSNHEIWDRMRSLDPDLFVHMGDFHYENISQNDPSRFRRAFDSSLTSQRQGAFYRNVPIAYVWDDHDFGPDDSDKTSPGKPAALSVYQQYVPHYPLGAPEGKVQSVHQAFDFGRIRFILTDVRAERDPETLPDGPDKSMLGKEQLAWFENELRKSAVSYPLVVWVNSVPWITKEGSSSHGWQPFSHERKHIADLIKSLGLQKRLLMLSGDAHMVAADDGTNSNYASDQASGEKGFPVYHASPFDRFPRKKGGPYSHGSVAKRKLFGVIKDQQYGQIDIKDDGKILELKLSGYDSNGKSLGIDLNIRCENSECRVTNPK